MKNNYFTLYSQCVPVKGAKRSIICDLGRNDFLFIENEHYEMLQSQSLVIEEENSELIEFLLKKDYGFMTNTPELFPKLTFDYKSNSFLSNIIVEIDNSLLWLDTIIQKSKKENVESIELRLRTSDRNLLYEALDLISKSSIRSVTLCLNNYLLLSDNFSNIDGDILKIKSKHKEIKIISFFNCSENSNYLLQDILVTINKKDLINNNCGKISPLNFSTNVVSFVEAKNCNSCLNKKIAIDTNGNIKPCPSINKNIGYVKEIDIKSLRSNPELLKYNIKKDQIDVCKDCEFRYICHDCRAYLDEDKLFSKPIHCKYNPYTAKWEN